MSSKNKDGEKNKNSDEMPVHIPVMVRKPRFLAGPGKLFGTPPWEWGHARAILDAFGEIDRIDQDMSFNTGLEGLASWRSRYSVKGNFAEIEEILTPSATIVDSCFDLGVSSFQLDCKEEGFLTGMTFCLYGWMFPALPQIYCGFPAKERFPVPAMVKKGGLPHCKLYAITD